MPSHTLIQRKPKETTNHNQPSICHNQLTKNFESSAAKVALTGAFLFVVVGGIYLSVCDVSDHSWCTLKDSTTMFRNMQHLASFFIN
jgi:hypothetical protein